MSVRCTFMDGSACDVREGETLLQACRRNAIAVPFSCTAGICHACLLQARAGEVPASAQRGLPGHLRERGYLLACQCRPQEPLVLAPPDPADAWVDALLHDAEASGGFLHVRLETARALACGTGSLVLLVQRVGGPAAQLEVTGVDPEQCLLEGLLPAGDTVGEALRAEAFGASLFARAAVAAVPAASDELAPPPPDAGLWNELGEGAQVRAVLEDFYTRVYADERLAPFFHGVTRERSVDKQYSFLRQLMTGERVYFGDRPRNAHHWMVISGELFDYRQELMRQVQAAHGLTPAQSARWSRVELHYRADIVKAHAWPRVVDGVAQPLEGYSREVLSEATVCDHCGAGIDCGVEVRYHVRLGTVSCPGCAAESVLEPS